MHNKYVLLSILIITSVFLSGCIFDDNNNKPNQTIGPDFIPRTNLPPGFSFMGVHDTTKDIANSTFNMSEGVYRYGGEDIYIQAIKNDNADVLLSKYKEELRQKFVSDYNPFEEITLNGHSATKYSDIRHVDGKRLYSIIWVNKGYLIQVGSFADFVTVISLATATGY